MKQQSIRRKCFILFGWISLTCICFITPYYVIFHPYTTLHYIDNAQCFITPDYIQGLVSVNSCGTDYKSSGCSGTADGFERVYFVNASLSSSLSSGSNFVPAVTCFAQYGHTASNGYNNGHGGFLNTWLCQSCLFSVNCSSCINPSDPLCIKCMSQLCNIPINQTVPCSLTKWNGQYVAFIRSGQDRAYYQRSGLKALYFCLTFVILGICAWFVYGLLKYFMRNHEYDRLINS